MLPKEPPPELRQPTSFGKIIIHHSASRFSSQYKSPTLARHLSPSPGGVMVILFPLPLMEISLQKHWQQALSKGRTHTAFGIWLHEDVHLSDLKEQRSSAHSIKSCWRAKQSAWVHVCTLKVEYLNEVQRWRTRASAGES